MKNLKKFNEDIDVDGDSTESELIEKANRIRYVVESFNDNFLEFLDEGYQYKMKFYNRIKFGQASDGSRSFDYDEIKNIKQFGSLYTGIVFYIITPCDFNITDVGGDLQVEQKIFDNRIDELEKTISSYKNIKEKIQDNVERLVKFYKLETVGDFFIFRHKYKLAFALNIKL